MQLVAQTIEGTIKRGGSLAEGIAKAIQRCGDVAYENFETMVLEYDGTGNYDDDMHYEVENYVRGGMPINRAWSRAASNAGGRGQAAGWSRFGSSNLPAKQSTPTPAGLSRKDQYGSKAQANFSVTRLTSSIAGVNLPVVLFGAVESLSQYRRLITLPAGITLTSVAASAGGQALDFTYTDGTNTDVVRVSCAEVPYPSFLGFVAGGDMFIMGAIRYRLNTATLIDQFNQEMRMTRASVFGAINQNPVNVAAYDTPETLKTYIVDVLQNFDIDKETSVVTSIIPSGTSGTPFSFTISGFIQKVYKDNTQSQFHK